MDAVPGLWQQFGASHPIYSHILVLLVGGFIGPRIIAWLETKGIPVMIDWFDARQDALLKRAGLSADQIRSVKEHEIKDLRRSADELEANLKAGSVAGTPETTP